MGLWKGNFDKGFSGNPKPQTVGLCMGESNYSHRLRSFGGWDYQIHSLDRSISHKKLSSNPNGYADRAISSGRSYLLKVHAGTRWKPRLLSLICVDTFPYPCAKDRNLLAIGAISATAMASYHPRRNRALFKD